MWSNQQANSLTFPPGAVSGARMTIDSDGIFVYNDFGELTLEIQAEGQGGIFFPGVAPVSGGSQGIEFSDTNGNNWTLQVGQFLDALDLVNINNGAGLYIKPDGSVFIGSEFSLPGAGVGGLKVGAGDEGMYYYEECNISGAIASGVFTNLTVNTAFNESDYGSAVGSGHFIAPVTGNYDFQLQARGSAAMGNGRFVLVLSTLTTGGGVILADSDITYSAAVQAPSLSISAMAHLNAGTTVFPSVFQSSGVAQAFTGSRLVIGRRL